MFGLKLLNLKLSILMTVVHSYTQFPWSTIRKYQELVTSVKKHTMIRFSDFFQEGMEELENK